MKQKIYILGLVTIAVIVIGALLKTNHWPGGGQLLILGIAMLVLAFLPLALRNHYKTEGNSNNRALYIVTWLTCFVVFGGMLFKAMHWPGAGILIYIAHGILILMIPVMFIRGTKESDPVAKMRIFNTAILFTFIIGVSIYIWWRTSLA